MKKKSYTLLLSATLASSLLFSSCIGSFGLSNRLLEWNKNIDSKFVNELVFIAFWIIPVYEVAALADVLVLNSIEFWSGSNPVADTGNIQGAIKTTANPYNEETTVLTVSEVKLYKNINYTVVCVLIVTALGICVAVNLSRDKEMSKKEKELKRDKDKDDKSF
jgi:hypothetical protein